MQDAMAGGNRPAPARARAAAPMLNLARALASARTGVQQVVRAPAHGPTSGIARAVASTRTALAHVQQHAASRPPVVQPNGRVTGHSYLSAGAQTSRNQFLDMLNQQAWATQGDPSIQRGHATESLRANVPDYATSLRSGWPKDMQTQLASLAVTRGYPLSAAYEARYHRGALGEMLSDPMLRVPWLKVQPDVFGWQGERPLGAAVDAPYNQAAGYVGYNRRLTFKAPKRPLGSRV